MSPTKGTPPRAIRIDDALWAAAKKKAEERGEKLPDVIRDCLRAYAEYDD